VLPLLGVLLRLSFLMGRLSVHTLVENRNGLIAAAMTTQAAGRAERDAALLMLHELTREQKRSDHGGPAA
jgi:hypothetical protein